MRMIVNSFACFCSTLAAKRIFGAREETVGFGKYKVKCRHLTFAYELYRLEAVPGQFVAFLQVRHLAIAKTEL